MEFIFGWFAMLIKKIAAYFTVILLNFLGLANLSQAAINSNNALTLAIRAPAALANLRSGWQANPVYLQFTYNDGSAPIYSDAVYPGDNKTVELKLTNANTNGGQIQFVSSNKSPMQPMSFIYAFSGERLRCLINKNAVIQVEYNINNKLLDVLNIPADC